MRPAPWLLGILTALHAGTAHASDLDEFKIKRAQVFEFAQKPVVTRDGDTVTVSFASKALCDVTVAIEDEGGRIIRHLACGVLGPKVPPPLKKNSLKQTLVWDGKDDAGAYVDDKDSVTVRVSLGLRARFERTLMWSPYKRWGSAAPIIQAAPEGVYVFDRGGGVSTLQLFDHKGDYVRTVYPFPADKVNTIKELKWLKFPQDGKRLPRKRGHRQCTLLSSGTNSKFMGTMGGGLKHSMPDPAKGMAIHGKQVALGYVILNRFATDGSSLGMPLEGGKTGAPVVRGGRRWYGGEDVIDAGPGSMAFSPNGKRLYTTAHAWLQYHGSGGTHEGWLNGVGVVDFAGDRPMRTFAGNLKGESLGGTKPGEFRTPASVTCDAKGRVYVADNLNDRVQIFSAAGVFLKAIKAPRPVDVAVHPKTGKVYVLSWLIPSKLITFRMRREKWSKLKVPPNLLVFRSFDDPKQEASYAIPRGVGTANHGYEIDVHSDPLRVWISPDVARGGAAWSRAGIRVLELKGGKLVQTRDFGSEARQAIHRTAPPKNFRQRLYVNHRNGKLYLAESDAGVGKSLSGLLEIDPATGNVRELRMPFDAEDIAFDREGLIYLRARTDIVRYDMKNWREVPWDYGEQRKSVGFASSRAEGAGMRRTNVRASLRIPSKRYNHHGGMMLNARGDLVVGIHGGQAPQRMRGADPNVTGGDGKAYAFKTYPGRATQGLVLVFNKHGKPLYDDALPGIAFMHGIGMDKDHGIYTMAMAHRIHDGKPYHNEATDTLLKVRPRAAKVYSSNRKMTPVPLTDAVRPDGPPHILGRGGARLGNAWVDRAEWFYGGVGYHGRHSKTDGFGCDCSNSRFDLDHFARSFAPEVEHCSVAVLDSAGNLILRVGTYGNVDDAGVSLFYAPYVAVRTDRRLFIADPGNHRIVSVKLDYHAETRVSLKDVSEKK
jgi:hypothetical protein